MDNELEEIRNQVNEQIARANTDKISLVKATRNLVAIIDEQFSTQVSAYRWYGQISASNHVYAVADVRGTRVSLQRFVLSLHKSDCSLEEIKHVSFKNKLSLDCRLENLEYRLGRQAVMRNRRPKRNTSSQYKGVIKTKRGDGSICWRGQIKWKLGTMSLGSFDDEKWAATVYDAAAFLLFEGAGFLNFPEDDPNIEALDVAHAKIKRFQNRKRNLE